MTISEFFLRVLREKVLLGGLGTAVIGLLLVLGLDPTILGAVTILVGALIALLRAVLVPANEVIVQQKPGEVPKVVVDDLEGVRKGATAWVVEAQPQSVVQPDLPVPGEEGQVDLLIALATLVLSMGTGIGFLIDWKVAVLSVIFFVYTAFRLHMWSQGRGTLLGFGISRARETFNPQTVSDPPFRTLL